LKSQTGHFGERLSDLFALCNQILLFGSSHFGAQSEVTKKIFPCFGFCHNAKRFLFDVVVDLVEYTNALIQVCPEEKRGKKLDFKKVSFDAQSRIRDDKENILSPKIVRFLGRFAFCAIFRRKQSSFVDVLRTLHHQLSNDP
jgi:hypothetical protein